MSGWELEKIEESIIDENYTPDESEIEQEFVMTWEEFKTAADVNFLTDEDGYAVHGDTKYLASMISSYENPPEKVTWVNK